jgi:dynein heavy chain, axonemal
MESEYLTFTPTKDYKQTTFRKDIKESIMIAGVNRRRVSLVITDNNITQNFILEDINNLLNNGEITNLLDAADWNRLMNDLTDYMKSIGRPEIRENYYETFVEMTREFFHIIFATSPVGDALRIRCRKFPALINCCNLNWFTDWPNEALVSCCENLFKDLKYFISVYSVTIKL